MRKIKALFWIGALVLAALSPAWAQTLDINAKGRIEFQSFTPKTMFDLARERRQNWDEQTVWGDLSFPSNASGKVPVIVLMHGSGGIERSMEQWVDAFNDMGVATFVVHVFESRGVKRTAEDQTLVPYAADLMDALQSLQLLARHPRIDAKRIGIMGFSRGGSVAFQTALEPFRKAVIKSDLQFALHIPMYAGCNQIFWSPRISQAPILSLVGADDDYATAAPCEALAAKYTGAGANVRTIKYAGAEHSWDATYKVFFLANATMAAPCGVVRTDIETWKITAEKTDTVIPRDRISDFYQGCVTRGAHVGRNELAFRRSRADIQAFVQSVFFEGK